LVFERKRKSTSAKTSDLNNCVLNFKGRPTPFPSQLESSIVCFSQRMASITVKEAMWAFLTAGFCYFDIAAVHPVGKPFVKRNLESVVCLPRVSQNMIHGKIIIHTGGCTHLV